MGKNRCYCCLQSGYLNDHYSEKELFIRFTRAFRERLSNFVCFLLSLLVSRVGCGICLYYFLIIAFLFILLLISRQRTLLLQCISKCRSATLKSMPTSDKIYIQGSNNIKIYQFKHYFEFAYCFFFTIIYKSWNLYGISGILFDAILSSLYDPHTIFFTANASIIIVDGNNSLTKIVDTIMK